MSRKCENQKNLRRLIRSLEDGTPYPPLVPVEPKTYQNKVSRASSRLGGESQRDAVGRHCEADHGLVGSKARARKAQSVWIVLQRGEHDAGVVAVLLRRELERRALDRDRRQDFRPAARVLQLRVQRGRGRMMH